MLRGVSLPQALDAAAVPTFAGESLTAVQFSNLPAAASSTGKIYRVSDIGPSGFGSLWISTGTRWSPLGGSLTLSSLGAAQSGIANSETIVLQTLIPAGAWQTNDYIRVWATLTKSGTTDFLTQMLRIGTAGTTSDTSITPGTNTGLNAANINVGCIFEFALTSATAVQRVGAMSGATAYSVQTAIAIPPAVTISSESTNALYVSLSIQSSGASNTVGIQTGQIQLITP